MGTTVEKADYAFETKDLLKTEINKINNVLTDESTFRSYPQELFNGYLDILNNGTDILWNNLEKVSQTGTEAALEGVETAPIKMVLNGNTSQDGTPTPDTPVEVKVVTGNNTIKISNEDGTLEANYPINLGNLELCKIGDYKDYLYKNNGKWYKYKAINKIVFDGTNNLFANKTGNAGNVYATSNITDILPTNSNNISILAITNHFKVYPYASLNNIDVGFVAYERANILRFKFGTNSSITTLELANQWLSNNNVTLYYVLATPTEEEITDETLIEQLEAISKAKSVKDKTYITQTNDELPFILDVEAIKEYEVN